MSETRPTKSNSWKHGGHGKRPQTSALAPGMKGFLCTCNQYNEKDCIRDSYNLLNLYADQLEEPKEKKEPDGEEATGDVDASLAAELAELQDGKKGKRQMRFQAIASGAKGVVFIKTSLPDPGKIVNKIVNEIYTTKKQQCKSLLRLLPVEITCKAYVEEITKAADTIFPGHFSEGNQTFAIIFTHRNNNSLVKDDVILALATKVTDLNKSNTVKLTAPDKVVLVEVIKGICCLAVVPDYHKFKKYNLLEMCVQEDSAESALNIVNF